LDHHHIETATRLWVETIVIGLNLCPFAKREMIKNSVRFIVSEAETEERLLLDLHDEMQLMTQDDDISTTLLIHPHVLQNFHKYNLFLPLADGLIQQMKLEGVYQIASFHPQYQFADTSPDDAENFTNRSPYPILHILREASLEKAIDDYPDVDNIPARNILLLREMGSERMKGLLQSCLRS
jgi:uncharacterized protein